LSLAGRALEILHTPGHALHHQVFVDRAHACIFTGDTFGISYRELDSPRGAFIVPTTTPTQFDPEQLIASVDRLLSYSPRAMYLMHFSRVTDVPRLGQSLKGQIRELTRIAEQSAAAFSSFQSSMKSETQSFVTCSTADRGRLPISSSLPPTCRTEKSIHLRCGSLLARECWHWESDRSNLVPILFVMPAQLVC